MTEVDTVLSSLIPAEVDGYYLYHPYDDKEEWVSAVKHQREMGTLFDAVREHFDLEWDDRRGDVQGRVLMHFSLRPKTVGG